MLFLGLRHLYSHRVEQPGGIEVPPEQVMCMMHQPERLVHGWCSLGIIDSHYYFGGRQRKVVSSGPSKGSLENLWDGGWRGEARWPSGLSVESSRRAGITADTAAWSLRVRVAVKPESEPGHLPAPREQPRGEGPLQMPGPWGLGRPSRTLLLVPAPGEDFCPCLGPWGGQRLPETLAESCHV